MNNALLLVDIQKDFILGGALPVPDGGAVVRVANDSMNWCDLIVATQDWHPANHGSFASCHPGRSIGDIIDLNGIEQVLWPDHCVQYSVGAEFADQLRTDRIDQVIRKGTDPGIDSYSGFFDNDHRKATGLEDCLEMHQITHLFLIGLATDYCVKFTALDARRLGLSVTIITDGIRGVDLTPGDCDRAVEEMEGAGVMFADSSDLTTESTVHE